MCKHRRTDRGQRWPLGYPTQDKTATTGGDYQLRVRRDPHDGASEFRAHISIQFPTTLGLSADDVKAQPGPKLDAIAGVPLPVMDVPDSVIVVKVVTDDSVEAFVAL
jgi:hypothetical protein